jgi:ABC-2 type transport system ATP-binding protein
MMTMDRRILASSLTKHYEDGIFVHHKGFDVSLFEPNGASKTTTTRMLTGLTKPTYGTANVSGRDCVKEDLALRRRIGVVSETSNLYNETS